MSKYIMFDFRCDNPECGAKFAAMVKPDVKVAMCTECRQPGHRIISAVRLDYRMGVDPHGCPTAGDKWARMHREEGKRQRKLAAENEGAPMPQTDPRYAGYRNT